MADSSESDSEEDSKLREALDTSTLMDNLYGKSETGPLNGGTNCDGGAGEETNKIIANGGFKQEGKVRPHLKRPCGPSLRRDKQSEEEIVSDIQVDWLFDPNLPALNVSGNSSLSKVCSVKTGRIAGVGGC